MDIPWTEGLEDGTEDGEAKVTELGELRYEDEVAINEGYELRELEHEEDEINELGELKDEGNEVRELWELTYSNNETHQYMLLYLYTIIQQL